MSEVLVILETKAFCTTFCLANTLGLLALSLYSVRSAVRHLQPNIYDLIFTLD